MRNVLPGTKVACSFRRHRPVVVTHHLPKSKSVAARYADSDMTAAYASHLDGLNFRCTALDSWAYARLVRLLRLGRSARSALLMNIFDQSMAGLRLS